MKKGNWEEKDNFHWVKKLAEKENLKEKLKELISRNTEYWLPYGKYDKKKGSCFIIEEKEPFFWRINPKWAEELAEKIIEFFKGRQK
jgi:hypothetical protein